MSSSMPKGAGLRGARLLQRSDQRSWASVLEPILSDTVGVRSLPANGLDLLDWLVQAGLSELERQPLPKEVLHPAPDDPGQRDAVHFASFVVTHRAERLLQLTELSAGALDNLEWGSLQLSAIAARALFEIAAVTSHSHGTLEAAWRECHGDPAKVRALTGDPDSELWRSLWEARLGTRMEESLELGWPKAVNAKTRIDHFGKDEFRKGAADIYQWLCEATHPNVESQGVFWRLGDRDRRRRNRLQFEPTASQSPVKTAIIDALRVSYVAIVPYCRDLWWVAAEVSSVCQFSPEEETEALGLPQPGGRNDPCCCGSGLKTKGCAHPEPASLLSEWEGASQQTPC